MFDIFHSAMLMYFAIISPSPERIILIGAAARTSVSPMTVSATRVVSESFSPSRITDEVPDA